jgi:hypothetical protein
LYQILAVRLHPDHNAYRDCHHWHGDRLPVPVVGQVCDPPRFSVGRPNCRQIGLVLHLFVNNTHPNLPVGE